MTTQSEAEPASLPKTLDLIMLISIGLGGTIGTPIFTIIGTAAGMAGPALIISILLGGGLTLLIGLTYSELGSAFPESGGGYTFARKAFGGLLGFLTGWLMVFSFVVFGGLSALGFAYVVGSVFGMPALGIVGIALAVLVAFTYLNIIGVRGSGIVQTVLTVVLVGGLVVFVAVCAFFISPGNFADFMPAGWGGVLQATAFLYVAYFGFETIATVGGESAEPRKHLARSTMFSILICTILYALVSVVAIGVIGVGSLASSQSPLVLVASASMGGFGTVLIVVLGVIATLTSLNVSIVAASRTIYALSNDGLLPGILATLGKYKTPHLSTLMSSILMGLFISLGVLNYVAHVADFNLFLALSLISLSLIVLKRKRSLLNRPFVASPWAAVVSIIALLGLILFLDRSAIATGTAIVILGILVYLQRITPLKSRAYLMGGISLGGALVLLGGLAINRWSLVVMSGDIYLDFGPLIVIACVLSLLMSVIIVIPLTIIAVPLTTVFKKTPIVGLTTTSRIKTVLMVERVIGVSVLILAALSLLLFYAVYYNLVFLGATSQPEGIRFLLGLCLVSFSFAEVASGFFLVRRRYVDAE